MYGKGPAVAVGAAAAIFAATNIRAVATVVAAVILVVFSALALRRFTVRRARGG